MQVVCDHCGKPVRVFSETATSMPCPHCGKEVALSPAAPAEPPDSALTELEGYAAVAKSVRRGRIDFICGQCNKRLAAQLDSAGKTVTCPNCRSSLQVPELEDGAAATSAAAPTGDGSVFDDDLRLTTGPAMAAPAQTVPAPQAADLLVASPAGSVRPANGNGKNPKTARKRSLSTILAVVGGIILAAAIALAATHFLTEDVGPTGGDEIGEIDQPFPADVVTVDDPGESDQPGPDVAFVEDDPVDTSASDAPGGPRAAVSVVAAFRDVFANAGYLAARPGREYVKIAVKIRPADRSIAFNTYGPDVTLSIGGEAHEALGALSGCSVFPLTGVRMPAGIASGQTRSVMFLFDLPAHVDTDDQSAVLRIERVGETPVSLPPCGETPDAPALVGEYVEAFPRCLEALGEGPILTAIEGYPNHSLIVLAGADGLTLQLPGVGVVGTVAENGDGFAATLRQGARQMDVTVRAAEGGKRVVLFFGEDGTSQLTFVRAGEAPELLLLPLVNDNDREPWALGTPRPIKKPTETQTPTGPKPYRPTGRGGPTSIFDF